MNFNKFINSDYLKSNPLCGINTYKDELNLATGVCMRKIRKLVFDGTENWRQSSDGNIYISLSPNQGVAWVRVLSTHFTSSQVQTNGGLLWFVNANVDFDTVEECKSYLARQYANGTPVTAWYVLATPITETITVPSGLSGTVEGYLNQSGTPTPTNPIYPTANTVEQWFDLNHYIMGTDTDTITTLPADIYVNDTTATVGLKGNMSQSSTPTSSSPIQPSECGERTGNLWNEDYTGISGSIKYVSVYVGNGSFTLSTSCPAIERAAALFFLTGNVQSGASTVSNGVYKNRPITVTSTDGYVTVAYRYVSYATGSADPRNEKTMLNLGSTALPYEPYGYKIPILSANTTTNVYLGEVESTRRIKKYEFTGEENGTIYSTATSRKGIEIAGITGIIGGTADIAILAICTHYQPNTRNALYRNTDNGISNTYQNDRIIFYDASCQTVESFQQFCAQQYSNGTPVTVWYVLATPITGIVNEPIRKIGDYADEVSGITIPTIAGANTISVDTTLQPSEVTVNYKGWHPVQSTHEKSKNLFDYNAYFDSVFIPYNVFFNYSSIQLVPNTTYTLSTSIAEYGTNPRNTAFIVATTNQTPTTASGGISNISPITITTENDGILRLYKRISGSGILPTKDLFDAGDWLMLNTGSTTLPYEPYWK